MTIIGVLEHLAVVHQDAVLVNVVVVHAKQVLEYAVVVPGMEMVLAVLPLNV